MNKTFTENTIWNAIRQASNEAMDDCEYSGVILLAEAILKIPYETIKTILEEDLDN